MKKLLLLVILPLVFAQDIYTSQDVILDLSITGGFTLTQDGPAARTDSMETNLSFFPQNTFNQQVLTLTTTPSAQRTSTTALFYWENPLFGEHTYRVDAKIKTINRRKQITTKTIFPLEDVPASLTHYLRPSPTIDSKDPAIITKANELAAGYDDLYFVVHAISDWVEQNIAYDLSTVTADVSQNSSWVLANRQGVCDELTNLFIGMLRAIGIPARFVSGISYTNSELFTEKWGPHGWAEVYFGPTIGWVPWDVTYGEFGYIDPTHVTLKTSLDATDASASYQWLGYNMAVTTTPLDFSIDIDDIRGQRPDLFDVTLEVVQSEIGFGSHNLVVAHITNLQNSYQSITLTLSKSLEVTLLDPARKHLALLPNGEGVMTWLVRSSSSLDSQYRYTMPVVLTTATNQSFEDSFVVISQGDIFSATDFTILTQNYAQESLKQFSAGVLLDCSSDSVTFVAIPLDVTCTLTNNGNKPVTGVQVCLDQCATTDLGISQTQTLTFTWKGQEPGRDTIVITAEHPEVHKTDSIDVLVQNTPSISITELSAPESVAFTDQFKIAFNLHLPSFSAPLKDVKVRLTWDGLPQEWAIAELDATQPFDINLKGNALSRGATAFELLVTGVDDLGNSYQDTERFSISLQDLTFFEHIQVFLRTLERKIAGWFR